MYTRILYVGMYSDTSYREHSNTTRFTLFTVKEYFLCDITLLRAKITGALPIEM